jgi:hypothetical protein
MTYTADGVVVKVSAHELGYLMPPFDDPLKLRKAEAARSTNGYMRWGTGFWRGN